MALLFVLDQAPGLATKTLEPNTLPGWGGGGGVGGEDGLTLIRWTAPPCWHGPWGGRGGGNVWRFCKRFGSFFFGAGTPFCGR